MPPPRLSTQSFPRRSLAAAALAVALVATSSCDRSPTGPPTPDAIVVASSDTVARVGVPVALRATYLFGGAREPADTVQWSSSDPASLTVDADGTAHGLAYTGAPVTVTATARGVSGTTSVFVLPQMDSLVVTVSATLAVGRTVRPSLVSAWRNGLYRVDFTNVAQLPMYVSLTSSAPEVLSVSTDGTVTAKAAGRATLTGRVAGVQSSVVVDVVPGLPVTVVDGTDGMTVTGVNDAGDVIGTLANAGARVRIHAGAAEDLGACQPRGINNSGQIACAVIVPCSGACYVTTPGLYSGGTLTTPFGTTSGEATGINEDGAILGWTHDPNLSYRVFVRTADGTVVYRDQGSPSWIGHTYDLNAALEGLVQNANTLYPIAYVQRVGSTTSLGCDYGRRVTEPAQLNDAGDAVGQCRSAYVAGDHGGGARVWRAATAWTPEMPSYGAQNASGISEDGHVAGNGRDGPFVWHDGRYTILSHALADAGWTLTSAAAMSRSGKVAAIGEHTSGKRGVVLIDVATLP